MATTTVATLEAIITANSTGFNTAMDSVRASIAGVEQQSKGLMSSMQKVGTTMTAAVTLPLLGIGAAAVKAASGFDASMRNINSIAGMTEQELASLSARVLEFGSANRSGPAKTAEALYEVYSAGIMGEKAFELMTLASKTAEAGMSDFSTTTKALTATVSAYTSMNLTAAEASNVWTRMVQVGVGSMEEFLSGAQRVLPSAANLGISFQNLGANIAYMSQQGGGAAMAETAVSMAMTNLMKPVKAMSAAFQQLGVQDAKGLIEKFGSLEEAVYALHEVTGNEVDFAKMFSKSGLQYATTVVNNIDQLRQSVADFGVGLGDATQNAWDEQMKSYAAQTDKFNASMETLMITIGMQLLPVLTPLIQGITNFFLNLSKTNPEILKFGIAFGIAAAAIGPVMLLITALANPITLLLAGITALGVAFATDFAGIRTIVTGAMDAIRTAIGPVIDMVRGFWEVITGTGVDLSTGLAVNGLVTPLQSILDSISGMGTTPIDPVKLEIPVEAGMTLWSIYYNSEWSKDLQGKMSYDEFVTQATSQIAGGDARWLQTGTTLTFNMPVDVGVTPSGTSSAVQIVAPYREDFLKLKNEITNQYNYVFGTGDSSLFETVRQPEVNLPILAGLKTAVDNIKILVDTWKDSFGTALTNIKDGITGFLDAFKDKDYSGLEKVFGIFISLFSTIATVVGIIASKVLIYVSDIAGSMLEEAGQTLANFLDIFNSLATGNLEAVGNSINIFITGLIESIANIVAHILLGDGEQLGPGLEAFGNGLRDAIYYVVAIMQTAWRDLKLSINQGVVDFLQSLNDAMASLNEAGLISDEQFSGFRITLNKLKIDTNATEFAKAIETAIKNGGKGIGTITIDGQDLTTSLMMGGAQTIADNLTITGKDQLLQAIKQGLTDGDANGNLNVLIPVAVAAGLDMNNLDYSNLSQETKNAIINALGSMTVSDEGQDTTISNTTIGKSIIDGITGGIKANSPDVSELMETEAKSWQDALENVLEVHSPSKWTMRVAGFLVTGFILGMTVGTLLLSAATTLMATLGIKNPLTNAITPTFANTTISNFMNALVGAINGSIGGLQNAVNGVISAFTGLHSKVLGLGNDLADKMQGIVNKITGQLNALKTAIQQAANLEVPSGGGGSGGGTYIPPGGKPQPDAASGGSREGWTWVGERGPELVNFDRVGSVVTSRDIRDVVSGGATNNNSNVQNTLVINGVQDVDSLLFELRRRGIVLA